MSEFVPFQIAKKLKEKGFPQHMCDDGYITEEDEKYDIGDKEMIWLIPDYLPYIAAPIVSQVLKWLRKEKSIICLPHIEPIEEKWFFYVVKLPQASDFPEYLSSVIYNTYEEAALAGIEWVLDNLI